jgi:hypothetical protein
VTFDYLRADLKDVNGHWQLWADGVPLKDFGNHEAEGRQALRLIRELHLNHRGTLGTPRPVVEYWFADRGASQGLASDLRVYPIDPQSLRVERLQNQWCLCDPHRALLTFGSDAGAARQALDVVRRRGFTGIGYVGQGMSAMVVFVTDPGGLGTRRLTAPALTVPHLATPARLPQERLKPAPSLATGLPETKGTGQDGGAAALPAYRGP